MAEGLNDLENAVLTWFARNYRNPRLTAQIGAARFTKREWTRVGFYVDFEVAKDLPPIDLAELGGHWPIYGPNLSSADIEFGGSSLLWGKAGYAHCIEMVANGNYFAEQVTDFTLSDWKDTLTSAREGA
jgi:hypothetical protein